MVRNLVLALGVLWALGAQAESLAIPDFHFGHDTGPGAQNGICEDRRFRGLGITGDLTMRNLARDAQDCYRAYHAGKVQKWDFIESILSTQCEKLDYGDDSSLDAHDGECDDPRFEGIGMDGEVITVDLGRDASDCYTLCMTGMIGLRNY